MYNRIATTLHDFLKSWKAWDNPCFLQSGFFCTTRVGDSFDTSALLWNWFHLEKSTCLDKTSDLDTLLLTFEQCFRYKILFCSQLGDILTCTLKGTLGGFLSWELVLTPGILIVIQLLALGEGAKFMIISGKWTSSQILRQNKGFVMQSGKT